MKSQIYQRLLNEADAFFRFKKTERLWHIPVLAALSVGIPLLLGLYFDKIRAGSLASLAGVVILYLPTAGFGERMRTLLICSFGFMISAFVGLVFSFNSIVGALVLGFFAFAVQWVCLYFRVRPPGSFFFVMLASIAVCMPFDLGSIPEKVGLIGLGTMNACVLALIYSALTWKMKKNVTLVQSAEAPSHPNTMSVTRSSAILGGAICFSLLVGYALDLQNPYWVPVSCAAVMQGGSTYHIWQRSFQRIFGTFVGVGICWLILSSVNSLLIICIAIMVLQFFVEMLVLRNYAIAVIFITPLTILLTEASNPLLRDPDILIPARFWIIALGSAFGAVGGWLTYLNRGKDGSPPS